MFFKRCGIGTQRDNGLCQLRLGCAPSGVQERNEEVCSVCDTFASRKMGVFSHNFLKDDTDAHAAFLREAAPLARA
jgi:hypothetical protein